MSAFLCVSDVLQRVVADRDGSVVGNVVDVLIDRFESRIAYVTIAVRLDEGQKARNIVIPWSMLTHRGSGSRPLRLTASKATIFRIMQSERVSSPVAEKASRNKGKPQ